MDADWTTLDQLGYPAQLPIDGGAIHITPMARGEGFVTRSADIDPEPTTEERERAALAEIAFWASERTDVAVPIPAEWHARDMATARTWREADELLARLGLRRDDEFDPSDTDMGGLWSLVPAGTPDMRLRDEPSWPN